MARKAKKKKKASSKASTRKKTKLKLRKKPLRDLAPRKKKTTSVKGGATKLTNPATLTNPSTLANPAAPTRAFAPPYVPVGPVVMGDNIRPPA